MDLRDHPLQRDHWWGSAEFEEAFGRLSINDILARICADFAIDADFTRPVPLTACRRPELRSTVLLVVDTDGPTKRWPAERWLAVASGIRDAGLDVRAVTRDDVALDLGDGRIDAVPAATPGEAVDVLSSARRRRRRRHRSDAHRRAAGNADGHDLSGQPGLLPAMAPHPGGDRGPLRRRLHRVEDDYAYNERVDLRGFEWQPRRCPVDGRCLDVVQPEDVLRAAGAGAVTGGGGRGVEIDSYPESRVRNSQPHGIGRVAALDGIGAWSNLGRNVVFVG